MDSLVAWLQSTALSTAIVSEIWVWPAAEAIHFVGLALVLGIIGLLDARLIGLFPGVSVQALRELVPYAVLGFGLSLFSGVVFLIGHPEQYVHNFSWWLKVLSLLVAGANAVLFEWTCAQRVMALGPDERLPWLARGIGAMSLVAWLSVLYWGRMLPFIGDAF